MPRLFLALLLAAPALAQDDPRFTRTEAMVPMRDGLKLYTAVFVPKDAKGPLPILFLRTPYGINGRAERQFKVYLRDLVADGYVFAFQDIRGRYRSEGTRRTQKRLMRRATPPTRSTGCSRPCRTTTAKSACSGSATTAG
jgi:predicted acyl esterase